MQLRKVSEELWSSEKRTKTRELAGHARANIRTISAAHAEGGLWERAHEVHFLG